MEMKYYIGAKPIICNFQVCVLFVVEKRAYDQKYTLTVVGQLPPVEFWLPLSKIWERKVGGKMSEHH